jgi:membrane protein YdbS with pleckstrin-like domain
VLAPREIDEYLLPSERRVIRVRQHWAVMIKDIIETLVFLVVIVLVQHYLSDGKSVLIDHITFYLALVALLRLTIKTIEWWVERIVITNKRVMIGQGIIVQNVGMMPLGKVTDLTFRRTLGGRIFNYGTMIVESAGQIQALNKVKFMPRPEEIYEALSELIFGEKGRTRASGMLAKTNWRRR